MTKFAYEVRDNRAINLRFVTDDYEARPDEIVGLGDRLPDPETLCPPTLKQIQVKAAESIDAAAGDERAKYITVAPGQDMTYQRKLQQAEAFLADAEPSAEKYPAIYNEVGITAEDAAGVAAVVTGMNEAWGAIADAIENVRLAAKKAVNEANDAAAVAAVLGSLSWPTFEE